MYNKKVKILIYKGLHIRPIIKIIELSYNFKSEIKIIKKNKFSNIKNLFQIQKLNISYNDCLIISATGIDEYISVKEIIKLIKSFKN